MMRGKLWLYILLGSLGYVSGGHGEGAPYVRTVLTSLPLSEIVLARRVSFLEQQVRQLQQPASRSWFESFARTQGNKILMTMLVWGVKSIYKEWRLAQLDKEAREERRLQQEERKKCDAATLKDREQARRLTKMQGIQKQLNDELDLLKKTKAYADSLPAGEEKTKWLAQYEKMKNQHFQLCEKSQHYEQRFIGGTTSSRTSS